jgi:predicted enzyme related to lactoylglutathione lyase
MNALVIFSVDVGRLATFYQRVLGLEPSLEKSGDIRLRSEQEELLIHTVPPRIAEAIEVRVPPEPREQVALKPVFNVDSLDGALDAVTENGGVVTGRTFTLNGLTRHDIVDPDGNIIQLRSSDS